MSMILDALTRAEHERQIEKQPKLKFVNPVKQQKKPGSSIWLWVALAVGINALVLAIILQTNSNDESTNVLVADSIDEFTPSIEEQTKQQDSQTKQLDVEYDAEVVAQVQEQTQQTPALHDSLQQEYQTTSIQPPLVESRDDSSIADARPLALESIDNNTIEPLDRPLIYEAKHSEKPKPAEQQNLVSEQTVETNRSDSDQQGVEPGITNKGAVSFSTTPLSPDTSAPVVAQAPKLLIDQGENTNNNPPSSAPSLKDLPQSSRNALSQYEVNVHVFDDDPQRRFVLINMDKYKEGQSIANNGPLVEEITREGVIVDYGDGRVLLPPM